MRSEVVFAHHNILPMIPSWLNGHVKVKDKMEATSPQFFCVFFSLC